MQPDSEEKRQLYEELSLRIKLLEKCKARLLDYTSFLIKKIKALSDRAIKTLNNSSSNYQSLIKTNEYSESQANEIIRILQSDLEMKFDPSLEQFTKIEEYFAQEFCFQSSKLIIKESSEHEFKSQSSTLELQEFLTEEYCNRFPRSKLAKFFEVHNGSIYCIAVLNNNKTIVTGGTDRFIKFWSLANQKVVHLLEGHTQGIQSIAISKDDSYIASGSWDKTVRVWNISEMTQCFVLYGHKEVCLSIALSDDMRWIASADRTGSVYVWSFKKQQLYITLKLQSGLARVVFTELSLFSGAEDGNLIDWDIDNFQQRSVIKNFKGSCFDISRNRTQIVSGLGEKLILWENGSIKIEFTDNRMTSVNAVKFACKDRKIISSSDYASIRVWSIEKKCQIAYFENHSKNVNCLTVYDDLFISGSIDGSITVWNASTLTLKSVIRPKKVEFYEIVFAENRFVYAFQRYIFVWNADLNCIEAEFQVDSVIPSCIAQHFNWVASGFLDGSVYVWSLTTYLQVSEFKGHTGEVLAVAICEDIIVSGSEDETIRVWNINNNEVLGVLRGHCDRVVSVALTSNADMVVSCSDDKTVKVWSVSKLQLLFTWKCTNAIYQVVLAKDNRYIFGGDGTFKCVRVWEYGKETEVCSLKNLNEAEKWILDYSEMRMLAEHFIW
jgi:WD40 repeat protein